MNASSWTAPEPIDTVESGAVVTIGNFDGVHRGHQYVVSQAVDRARALGLRTFAVTFYPDPEVILRPGSGFTYLTDPDEKVWLLRRLGVDDVWMCEFTRDVAQLTPEEFMRLVEERQRIAELWVGHDFALGRGRAGTITVLAEIGAADGWAVHMLAPYRLAEGVVSSTAVRRHLAAGEVRDAARLLGRPYSVCPQVVGASGEGVLLRVPDDRAVPAPGVYDVQARCGEVVRETTAQVKRAEESDASHWLLDVHGLSHLLLGGAERCTVAFLDNLANDRGVGGTDAPPVAATREALAGTLQSGGEDSPC